jgi:hydroxymethylpyrimidine pyrophosphatase-like HAD family hydrolase
MKLREYLMPLLPAYEIAVGGATSVDVVQKGIDKAYGVRKLAELLGLEVTQMLYIGDDLQEGGNDAVVIPTGIQTRVVKNPTETAQIIKSILES